MSYTRSHAPATTAEDDAGPVVPTFDDLSDLLTLEGEEMGRIAREIDSDLEMKDWATPEALRDAMRAMQEEAAAERQWLKAHVLQTYIDQVTAVNGQNEE